MSTRATTRAIAVAIGLTALVMTAVGSMTPAAAQENDDNYQPFIEGDLEVTGSAEFGPMVEITFSGSGFAPDSSVEITLFGKDNGVSVIRALVEAAGDGSVTHTTTLPDEMIEGAYTTVAAGMAEDGAVVLLSGEIFVSGNVVELTPSTTTPPETTVPTSTTAAPDDTRPTSTTIATTQSGSPSSTISDSGDSSTTASSDPTVPPDDSTTTTASDSGDDDSTGNEQAAGDGTNGSSDGGSGATLWIIVAVVVAALGGGAVYWRSRASAQA